MKIIVGVDIGGTKCAVSFAECGDAQPRILEKKHFPTIPDFEGSMRQFIRTIREVLAARPDWEAKGIGVSCGGPLDSIHGLILSPPNLPLWDHVDCVTPLRDAFGVPAALQNDADACALAEWKWGAGRGCQNLIFLTFGTGMGAGLILNGRLYIGAANLAGEVGHVRLAEDGPEGYGKRGSFEGFCSGGGIARLGRIEAQKALAAGNSPLFCQSEADLNAITAKGIAEALEAGDPLALEIYGTVGRRLGQGVAMLIDILNPELVIIGSIYGRQRDILDPEMHAVLESEALALSLRGCRVAAAGLGEAVGDYAALSVAADHLDSLKREEA